MAARSLRFFLRHAPVIVGVETFEHARAHCREFGARERAIAIRVGVRAIGPAFMPFTAFATFAALWAFVGGDNAVIVGVKAIEMFNRPGKKFVARDIAVIVRVGARQHVHAAAMMPAPTAMTTLAALGVHFFAREITVIVAIETREHRFASCVELGTRQDAVRVRVRLEKAMAAISFAATVLRLRKPAAARRQNRSTRGGQQNLTHVRLLLPAAKQEAATLPLSLRVSVLTCRPLVAFATKCVGDHQAHKKTAGAL
jgi:hypothetical protein